MRLIVLFLDLISSLRFFLFFCEEFAGSFSHVGNDHWEHPEPKRLLRDQVGRGGLSSIMVEM